MLSPLLSFLFFHTVFMLLSFQTLSVAGVLTWTELHGSFIYLLRGRIGELPFSHIHWEPPKYTETSIIFGVIHFIALLVSQCHLLGYSYAWYMIQEEENIMGKVKIRMVIMLPMQLTFQYLQIRNSQWSRTRMNRLTLEYTAWRPANKKEQSSFPIDPVKYIGGRERETLGWTRGIILVQMTSQPCSVQSHILSAHNYLTGALGQHSQG